MWSQTSLGDRKEGRYSSSVSKTGCAALRTKKSPLRKRGHQVSGCNDGCGKSGRSNGRLIVRTYPFFSHLNPTAQFLLSSFSTTTFIISYDALFGVMLL